MDNSPEYIKMILSLPDEFFNGWEWKAGDRAISLLDDQKEALIVEFDVWHDPKIVHVKFLGEAGYTYLFSLDNLRPLPRQDQLQAIVKKTIEKKHGLVFDDWRLLMDFYNVTHDSFYRLFSTAEYTLDIMWLQYTVYHMLTLKWNGEQWVIPR